MQTTESTSRTSTQIGTVTGSWPTATWRAASAPKGSVCCLAWVLSPETEALVTAQQLEELHHEMDIIASMLGATTLSMEGSQGVFLCDESVAGVQTPADTAIMFGQQLCRWTLQCDPPMCLRLGAHMGLIRVMTFASGRDVYVGQALTAARNLAERCPRDGCIYFLKATKNSLNRCSRLPLTKFGEHAFLLEVASDLIDDSKSSLGSPEPVSCSVSVNPSLQSDGLGNFVWRETSPDILEQKANLNADGNSTIDLDEFKALLLKHNVDLNLFGVGAAKSVEEFYHDTCILQRSRLHEAAGRLERSLELVRINLVAKDPKGTERMLRIATEVLEDGRMRTRNQKLAQVVAKGSTWEEAMAQCFAKKLGVPEHLQREAFMMDMSWLKTESQNSASFPGIPTKYLTRELRVRVLKPSMPELNVIGLPNLGNFSTIVDGVRAMWTWSPVGEPSTHEDILSATLQENGIDISAFREGGFEDLLDEIYRSKLSTLVMRDGELQRHLQIIKVWLCADIFGIQSVLVIRSKIQNGKRDFRSSNRPISMRMISGQSWDEALRSTLHNRLALDDDFQNEHLIVDEGSYRVREEVADSETFPGLTTVYRIHEAYVRVKGHLVCPGLGLPDGHEFAFSRVEGKANSGSRTNATMTYFCWKSRKELIDEKQAHWKGSPDFITAHPRTEVPEEVPDEKRRLPVVPPKFSIVDPPPPGRFVEVLMKNQRADWDRAWSCARRIRDEDYTLRHFHDDCITAFPELQLYIFDQNNPSTTSGRSADDEYQRTFGALFAVYWLVRYDLDGAQAFTFGVDENWNPLNESSAQPKRTSKELKQRSLFILNMQWEKIHHVLAAAGILTSPEEHKVQHFPDRVLAILVLTAIHDVMKIVALTPIVDAKHCTEWSGYKVGETVIDHDAGLAYLLEFLPHCLPSYHGLPPTQQESVKFTQCKMEYNMGWLVQGEAPPGALFRKFKDMIMTGQASASDVAFYFTHWLTDLAGAEPFPLEGCEKFVLKFPQKVLVAFLDSFPIVQNLGTKTETEVLEEYLGWRWNQHQPSLGPLPKGKGSIARQRLMTMSQASADSVLAALDRVLSVEDREVLFTELSRTGCSDQVFCIEGITNNQPAQGPAILVYYGPALMQKNATVDPAGALAVLAEVFRQSRALWPLSEAQANETVIVRIDALKELQTTAMVQLDPGEVWVLQRTSRQDAQVRRVTILDKDGTPQDLDLVENKLLSIGLKREAGDVSLDMHSSTRGRTAEEVEEPLNRGNLGPTCGNLAAASLCRWCLS